MSRKLLIRSKEYPYHVTARGNNREPFPCPQNEVWEVANRLLSHISLKYQAKIHAFVLMPNHFHLLISTPEQDLGIVMQDFMRSITKILNSRTGRLGRVFGAKYHWSLIDHFQHYDCVLKYVYRNPAKAKLSNRVEDYPYSTLKNLIFDEPTAFPLQPALGTQELVPDHHVNNFLMWLNEPFRNEQEEGIRKGLKRTMFSPTKTGRKRTRVQLPGISQRS